MPSIGELVRVLEFTKVVEPEKYKKVVSSLLKEFKKYEKEYYKNLDKFIKAALRSLDNAMSFVEPVEDSISVVREAIHLMEDAEVRLEHVLRNIDSYKSRFLEEAL